MDIATILFMVVGILLVGFAAVAVISAIVGAVRKKKAEEEAERQRLAEIRRKAAEAALAAESERLKKASKLFGSRTGRFSNANPNLQAIPNKNLPEKKKYTPSKKNDYDYDDNSATTNALLFGALASTWESPSSNDTYSGSSSSGYSSSSSSDSGSSSSSYSSSSDSGSSYSSSSDSSSSSW